MATAHFSMCERVLRHYGQDNYLLARLPLVLVQRGRYPRSYEVLVKEFFDPPAGKRALEILIESPEPPPLPLDKLHEITTDYYCSTVPTPNAAIPRDKNGRSDTEHRMYRVELS